jgi:hypothetical protein
MLEEGVDSFQGMPMESLRRPIRSGSLRFVAWQPRAHFDVSMSSPRGLYATQKERAATPWPIDIERQQQQQERIGEKLVVCKAGPYAMAF